MERSIEKYIENQYNSEKSIVLERLIPKERKMDLYRNMDELWVPRNSQNSNLLAYEPSALLFVGYSSPTGILKNTSKNSTAVHYINSKAFQGWL